MADPDSILQLGIEAARDGNRDEARNLFRMLTRQEPNNAQAWLWLAGVAENRDERQSALERVVELDPTNEMAIKGLQALGARPNTAQATPPPPPPPEPEPEPLPPPPARSALPDDDPFADDPFAELDALSDVMADAAGPVRRSEPLPSGDDDIDAALAGAATDSGSRSTDSRSAGSRSSYNRAATAATARNPRPSSYDDDETEPARSGLSPLMLLLLMLLLVIIGGGVIWYLMQGRSSQTAGGNQPTAAAQATSEQGQPAPTSDIPALGGVVTTEPITPTAALEQPTAAPAAEQPTAAPPPADVSGAQPQIVAANTPLSSEGWRYDFNQPTYAAPIIGPLGGITPANGRFVVVLVFAINETGQPQAIPANFFVLKDAQGRVWEARPDVSNAYVQPGINADLAHAQPLPPNGITHSVAIIFDVAPDATDLVFFARSNPGQGWLVLRSV